MSKYTGHFLALLFGITMTVGFYEGRRLIRNTSKAWAAAQTQVSGKEGNTNARRQALLKALEEEKGAGRVEELRQQRGERDETARVRQVTPNQLRSVRGVVQGRKTSLKDMPAAQREVIRERRKRRRERMKEDLVRPNKKKDAGDADAPLEPLGDEAVDEVEEDFEDTAVIDPPG